jgi:hypothetical protein
MKNNLIPRFWHSNASAKNYNKTYSTDGFTLYSYKLPIGTTTTDGVKVLYDYTAAGTFVSATTSSHVKLAEFYAHEKLNPKVLNSQF